MAKTSRPKTKRKSAAKGVATIDRRTDSERRKPADRRKKDEPVAEEKRVLQRRAKVQRRRQIDPTTCERDYTFDEVEFMQALERYKRTSGRMFPTCSEVLEVIRDLGYAKTANSASAAASPEETPETQPIDPLDFDESVYSAGD